MWQDDEDVCFVLDQMMPCLIFILPSSLKQHSTGRHADTHTHYPNWAILAPYKCCLLSREEENANFILFGLTWPGIKLSSLIHVVKYPIGNGSNSIYMYYGKKKNRS